MVSIGHRDKREPLRRRRRAHERRVARRQDLADDRGRSLSTPHVHQRADHPAHHLVEETARFDLEPELIAMPRQPRW